MSTALLHHPPLECFKRRKFEKIVTLYEGDAETGCALVSGDVVRFKVFSGTDSTVELDIDSAGANSNSSVVTITQLTSPAAARITVKPADTGTLSEGTHRFEVSVTKAVAATDPITIGVGELEVYASPSGDVGIT